MDADQPVTIPGGAGERGLIERTEPMQQPNRMGHQGTAFVTGSEIPESPRGRAQQAHGVRSKLVGDGVHREHPAREAGRGEFGDQSVQIIWQGRRTQLRFPIGPFVDHAPDASARAVPAWMGQWHLVVANDTVVEVGNVICAVRPEPCIDGAEPRVVGTD
jgi:hypothetical protein